MRLFWLVIGIFMIFAGVIVWAQMDTTRHIETVAIDADTSVMERDLRPAAPIGEAPAALEEHDVDEASDADFMPDTSMIDKLALEAREGARREGARIDDAELAELDEAQKLAEELFDSAMSRRETVPQLDEDEGYSPPPTSLDLKQGHEHRPEQIQKPDNPWEVAAKDAEERQPLAHSIREQPDGTIVLDETFEIKGKGTASQPYEITWDLLLSAAETYQPRLGMNTIPERIQMLDGKYVKISGHLLFPMVGIDAKEVLVMLNMWDGCCLGTMPSPYDAVEVQLAQPMRATNRNFMNFGTLTGRLNIDPYLINDWLLGLYVMEDARLDIGM
jgi:hypothetical protein